jgi:ketosteroid isomerase-like protein
MADSTPFHEAEIRSAERALVAALEDPDPTAWVYEYTEDAVFDAGGEHVVEGRDALLEMAHSMAPLSSVAMEPMRTEGHGPLATVWFRGSWVSGGSPDPVHVRAVIVWRKESDGRWRVALEHMA